MTSQLKENTPNIHVLDKFDNPPPPKKNPQIIEKKLQTHSATQQFQNERQIIPPKVSALFQVPLSVPLLCHGAPKVGILILKMLMR